MVSSHRLRFIVGAVFALLCVAASAQGPTWDELQAAYAYAPDLPLDTQAEDPADLGPYTAQTVRFHSVNDEIVPATVCVPKNVDKPPVVLILHGLGGSRQDVLRLGAPIICPLGIAVVGIDAQYHGDRKQEGRGILDGGIPAVVEGFRQSITDNRRAIDYIMSRDDLDHERVVLLGLSMGAIMGSAVAALDDRLKAACLVVGGGDLVTLFETSQIGEADELRQRIGDLEPFRADLACIDPVNFAGHISPRPTTMLNGRNDKIVPAVCGQALYDSLKDPKKITWYETGGMNGHIPPLDVLLKTLREFLTAEGLLLPPGQAQAGE